MKKKSVSGSQFPVSRLTPKLRAETRSVLRDCRAFYADLREVLTALWENRDELLRPSREPRKSQRLTVESP